MGPNGIALKTTAMRCTAGGKKRERVLKKRAHEGHISMCEKPRESSTLQGVVMAGIGKKKEKKKERNQKAPRVHSRGKKPPTKDQRDYANEGATSGGIHAGGLLVWPQNCISINNNNEEV